MRGAGLRDIKKGLLFIAQLNPTNRLEYKSLCYNPLRYSGKQVIDLYFTLRNWV